MKNILIYDNQIFDAEDANTYEESNKSELYGFIIGEKYDFKTLSLESKAPIDVSYCVVSIKDDKIYMKGNKCILSIKKNIYSEEIIKLVNTNASKFLLLLNNQFYKNFSELERCDKYGKDDVRRKQDCRINDLIKTI